MLYQVICSLDILRQERSHQLNPTSIGAIRSIVDTPEAHMLVDGLAKPFRNTLMHYGTDDRIDLTTVDLQAPLYGLVKSCFPGYDDLSLGAFIDGSDRSHCTYIERLGVRGSIEALILSQQHRATLLGCSGQILTRHTTAARARVSHTGLPAPGLAVLRLGAPHRH
jgi:hypothetical protein